MWKRFSSRSRCQNTQLRRKGAFKIERLEARLALSAAPLFSHSSGYYDSTFNLAITGPGGVGVTVHYTLDGSLPTASSAQYSAPISITTTTPVRAVAIKNGVTDSSITTSTFLFVDDVLNQDGSSLPSSWGTAGSPNYVFDPTVLASHSATIIDDLKSLSVISLTIDPSNFVDAYEGVERPPVVVEMFDSVNNFFSIDAGIQRQGGTSLGSDYGKANFRLYFDDEFGPENLEFPLFGADNALQFDKLGLRAGGQDGWGNDTVTSATYLRDRMTASIQNELGGYAPNGHFVQTYINGVYWGLYQLAERPDEHFAEAYFGGDDDDYAFVNAASTSADPDWLALQDAISQADYELVESLMDVTSFVDYCLANVYAQNSDWLPNWTATRNTTTGGKWQFHAYDGDRTFTSQSLSGITPNPDNPRTMFSELKASAEFKLLLADRAQLHLFNGGFLSGTATSDLWNALADEIDDAMKAESARWGAGRTPQAERGPLNPWTTQTHDDWSDEVEWVDDTYFGPNGDGVNGALFNVSSASTVLNKLQFEVNSLAQHGGAVTPGLSTILDIVGTSTLASNQTIYFTLDGTDPREAGGAVSSSAIEYDGNGIPLLDTTYVRARLYTSGSGGGTWSAQLEATFFANESASSENLAITELMYHPDDPASTGPESAFSDDDDFEYIELTNTGESTLDLVGARFTQGVRFDFSAAMLLKYAAGNESNPLTLAPGERVVVVSNLDAFLARYSGVVEDFDVRVAGEFAFDHRLDNSGERVRLVDANNEVIHDFTYTDDMVPDSDGDGPSMDVVDTSGDYSSSLNWQEGLAFGSPGFSSQSGPQISSVTIRSAAAAQHSHVMESGPDQLKSVPVGRPSIIQLAFNEALDPLSVDVGDLRLLDLGTGTVLTPASRTINSGNDVVTWVFSSPFPKGYYQIVVKDFSITNASGDILDGDWTNPTSLTTGTNYSVMPSGNGYAGGDFNFAFIVLPADYVRDGNNQVNAQDFSRLNSNYNAFPSGGATFADGDGDGDGDVDSMDLSILASAYNLQLNADLFLSGDSDSNGVVNYRDLSTYLKNRGATSAAWVDGDSDGDGDVDLDDLDFIYAFWGELQEVG
jgi:hypothetical protein